MKDLKISKELASEVFKLNVCETYIENNKLYFDMELPLIQNINIYEFAYKCKEWALNKGSYINCFYNEFWWDRVEKKYTADIPSKNKSFYEDTEIEAIIKACEWILKNKAND